MGDNTGISWTDATWNPIRGCSRVSEGCRNCYAETVAVRFCGPGQPYEGLAVSGRPGSKWTGEVRLIAKHLADPLKWKKPRRIFVNSMSDMFHERLSNEEIAALFGVMAAAPQHTFQVLTKRAKRMREWFAWFAEQLRDERAPDDRGNECLRRVLAGLTQSDLGDGSSEDEDRQFWRIHDLAERATWPLANVWLGVSVENQAAADERIPELLATPAAVRFLSCEPLLSPVDLRGVERGNSWSGGDWLRTWRSEREHDDGTREVLEERATRIDWVIAGCESGHGARPCSTAWLRSLRDQCAAADVAFFLKQAELGGANGEENLNDGRDGIRYPSGGKTKGSERHAICELPLLDGVQHAAFPTAVTT